MRPYFFCITPCLWNFVSGQSVSSQSFKHNSAHMLSSNLIRKLSFEPKCRMFIINRYYRKKSKSMYSFDSLFCLRLQILYLGKFGPKKVQFLFFNRFLLLQTKFLRGGLITRPQFYKVLRFC